MTIINIAFGCQGESHILSSSSVIAAKKIYIPSGAKTELGRRGKDLEEMRRKSESTAVSETHKDWNEPSYIELAAFNQSYFGRSTAPQHSKRVSAYQNRRSETGVITAFTKRSAYRLINSCIVRRCNASRLTKEEEKNVNPWSASNVRVFV